MFKVYKKDNKSKAITVYATEPIIMRDNNKKRNCIFNLSR